MPLTFLPQNRREFCRNVLGGALATAFWGASASLRADEAGRDHWVFLSDTHLFGDPDRVLHGTCSSKNFIAAREAILKSGHKPRGVIVTGDFAALQGKPEDYRQCVAQVAPYTESGIPFHVAFGNHDNLDNYFAAFTETRQKASPIATKHITVLETPNANLFLLDSLYHTNITSGLLGHEQLGWLKKELGIRKDKPALLFAHHNLDDRANTLMDRAEFWDVVKPAKQVKAYIYGHTHVYTQQVRDDIHLINLPALGWEFTSGKQPLGWSDVDISANGIQLALHTVPPEHPRNGDVRKFEWLR